MQLEIISRSTQGPTAYPPLLFVHGAFCGAWVWDEHFLSYFSENGCEAHALSLRGHGASDARAYVHQVSLSDYVNDLNQVVASLSAKPILIGHSLGGVVVQRWLNHHQAPGVVLMGSGPPHGMLPSTVGMLVRNPTLVMQVALAQAFGLRFAAPEAMRRVLFSDNLPTETVFRHVVRASPESLLVAFELAWPNFPAPNWDREMPILVLGAENDFFISPTMVKATAQVYRTRAEIFPDMAHAMMLDPGWRRVADRILGWLEQTATFRRS